MKNLVVREDGTYLIKNVRLSYPHLFKLWALNEGEVPKFSCKALLPKDTHREEIKALVAYAQAMAKEDFKSKVPLDKLFVRSGDDSGKPEQEGHFVVSCSETKRPNIIDRDKSPLTEEDGKPYAGCYINLLIRPWSQNNKWGKRINANLLAVQFVKDGEAFASSTRPDVDDVFDDIDDDFDDDLDAGKAANGDPDLDEDDDLPF